MNKILSNIKTKILTLNSITTLQSPIGYESDDYTDVNLQTNYQNSLYITRALEIIQDAVASVDFNLYKIINTKGEYELVPTSELINLLYRPNPLQTKSEFWKLIIINYKLSGEAFIRIIKEEGKNKPAMLISLNPKDVEVRLTEQGEIKYKLSKPNGLQEELSSEDIVYFKNPNPNSQLRGFSILRPLYARIEAEIKATEYQANLFGKNGNPDGILNVKGGSDADMLGKIKQAFYNSFRGKNESNRVAVIGGDVTYTPLQTGNNTLDFIASKNNVRDEVFMALGVPKSLVTSDDVNRANSEAGLQQFMQFTISPMFKMILEVLNERFVIPNYGEEYFIQTQDLVLENKAQLLEEAKAGIDKWLTTNDIRQRYGYDPIDGGDVLNKMTGMQSFNNTEPQVLQNAFKTRQNLYTKLKHQEDFKAFRAKQLYKKATASPEFKVKFVKAINSVRDKGELLMKKEATKMFKEQMQRVLQKAEEVGINITTASDLFNYAKEKREVEKAVLPLYTTIAVQAGNVALTPIKIITSKGNSFVMNSVLYKQLEHRANLFSESVTDTTYEKISIIVADNLDKGVDEIKKGLKEYFIGISNTRAEAIARTESGYMTSLGTQMAYEESEVVEGKEWLSAGDNLVRDDHRDNEAEGVIGVKSAFQNGEHFPAENSINCRCALAPVVII